MKAVWTFPNHTHTIVGCSVCPYLLLVPWLRGHLCDDTNAAWQSLCIWRGCTGFRFPPGERLGCSPHEVCVVFCIDHGHTPVCLLWHASALVPLVPRDQQSLRSDNLPRKTHCSPCTGHWVQSPQEESCSRRTEPTCHLALICHSRNTSHHITRDPLWTLDFLGGFLSI